MHDVPLSEFNIDIKVQTPNSPQKFNPLNFFFMHGSDSFQVGNLTIIRFVFKFPETCTLVTSPHFLGNQTPSHRRENVGYLVLDF